MTGAAQHLLVIYLLERRDGSPVALGEIAETIDRSNAATTEMLRGLASDHWIRYKPCAGTSLTPEGRVRGEKLHDTYVVLIQLFDKVLDIDEPEPDAMALVGLVNPIVAERFAETLFAHVDVAPDPTDLLAAPWNQDS